MYKKLLQKIDQFVEKVHSRNSENFTCKPGCVDCCIDGISVWRIEYENISEYLKLNVVNFQPSTKKDRCSFLNTKDFCSIYPVRPIVCRLWGTPTLYAPEEEPPPNIDEISKRITSDKGVLSCCNKNFTEESSLKNLKDEDIINLDLVLKALAAINHVYCKELCLDPTERFYLKTISQLH